MQVQELKSEIYKILSNKLHYNVSDTPKNDDDFPFVRISTTSLRRIPYKKGAAEYEISFSLDIFSNYNGEAELLRMEKEIYDAMPDLYKVNGVVNVSGPSSHFITDKSMGIVLQHGIIVYSIKVAGEEWKCQIF